MLTSPARFSFFLACSVALDIFMSILLVTVAVNQHGVSSGTKAALVANCQRDNMNKRHDVVLWGQLIHDQIPEGPHESKSLEALQARYHYLINVRDQQVNCVKLYG